jgi:hypothetical protein
MDKDQKIESLIVEYLHSFTAIFTMAVFTMLLLCLLVSKFAPGAHKLSTIFSLIESGLSYNTILQLALFSVISAFFKLMFFSEYVLLKMRFFLRYLLFLVSTMFTIIVLVIIYKWFPINNIGSWIGLIFSMSLLYIIGSGITFFIFKTKDKKYNKLLENYKKRHST